MLPLSFLSKASAVFTMSFLCCSQTVQAQQVTVDSRDFITQTAGGNMLCESTGQQLCLQGYWNQYGEFTYAYTNGILDFIGRSYNPQYFVGVIRNFSGYSGAADANQFRCFSNINASCTAPPTGVYPPQSIPMIFSTNIISAATEAATLNPDGTPNQLIPGSVSVTSGYQVFSVNLMDPVTCAQTFQGNIAHQVYVSYVSQISFGGDVGVKDALVIDEVEGNYGNGQFYPDHIERFYYVNGLGRVQDSSSGYNPATGSYTVTLGGASRRNLIRPSTIAQPNIACPMGSAPFQ